ncbi:MAG: biotin--[acetyl-CoA-carboxylase] ligase, partial [Actinomycetota bacterium]
GRAGRSWETPGPGALTCSVVLGPGEAPSSWAPLLVGLAVRCAVAPWVATRLKWPNDIVVDEPPVPGWGWGRKLGGVLCELHPGGAVVAGIGVNCRQEALPVPWAASIAGVAGQAPTVMGLLEGLGGALAATLADWRASPEAVRERYSEACATLGEDIRVELPGGREVRGRATAVADDGALVVDDSVRVTVGDVRRVRI